MQDVRVHPTAVAVSSVRRAKKPRICRSYANEWCVEITRGFEGNYEHEYTFWDTWRDAQQFAYETVKRWRR